MHRACAIHVCLFLLAAARAGAQEPAAPGAPGSQAQPMPAAPEAQAQPTPPPGWVPYYAPPPGPSAAELDALEADGHHKKRIGAILMGTGGGLALIGTGLMIAGAWHDDGHCHDYYYGYYYYDDHCGDTALTVAGATTTVIGLGALVPGIFIFVDGGQEVDAARRARARCIWGWHPTVHRGGAGVELEMSR